MKRKCLFLLLRQYRAYALWLGCVLLLGNVAVGQELLQNPGFESPLDPYDPSGLTGGKTNWTIVYVSGSPSDFAMHDRSTEASRGVPVAGHGAHLRPNTENWCHAYFTQTVTNLTPGTNYTLNGWMFCGFSNAKLHVYFEAIGGTNGTNSVRTIDATTTRTQYFLTNSAGPGGKIEVRLHLDKDIMTSDGPGLAKFVKSSGWFDDFSLTNTVSVH